jgi:hypothetical protein
MVQTIRATNAEALLGALEAGCVPPSGFHHRDHIHAAWLFLRREPPGPAIQRFCDTLRRFALAQGKPDLYHETITWCFLLLVRERMAGVEEEEDFEAFARRNPDLFAWKPSVLSRYYQDDTLAAPLARVVFVLPDRLRVD